MRPRLEGQKTEKKKKKKKKTPAFAQTFESIINIYSLTIYYYLILLFLRAALYLIMRARFRG